MIGTVLIKRPLVSVCTAKAILDVTEDDVLKKIETGELQWAFNISREGSAHLCIRIFSESLEQHQRRGALLKGETAAHEGGLEEVIQKILPTSQELIRQCELGRRLSCSVKHITNLCADGLLIKKGRTLQRTQSPKISIASAVNFLKARRML